MVKNIFRFEHVDNKYNVHGLVSWDRAQKIGLDVFGDYISREGYFWCRYSFSIHSSTEPIPNVNMTISHKQNVSNIDTNVYLMVSWPLKAVSTVNGNKVQYSEKTSDQSIKYFKIICRCYSTIAFLFMFFFWWFDCFLILKKLTA